MIEEKETANDKLTEDNDQLTEESSGLSSSASEQLRGELSCPICLEILFEPSTASCGHSFCRECLRSLAQNCGNTWSKCPKCPKCRHPISNGGPCALNTVIWNIIQLLFPQEVEARKAAGALNGRQAELQRSVSSNTGISASRRRATSSQGGEAVEARNAAGALKTSEDEIESLVEEFDNPSNQRAQASESSSRDIGLRRRTGISSQGGEDAELHNIVRRADRFSSVSSRDVGASSRGILNQDEDAALALRLQAEEFMMEAFDNASNQRAQASESSSRDIGLRRRNGDIQPRW